MIKIEHFRELPKGSVVFDITYTEPIKGYEKRIDNKMCATKLEAAEFIAITARYYVQWNLGVLLSEIQLLEQKINIEPLKNLNHWDCGSLANRVKNEVSSMHFHVRERARERRLYILKQNITEACDLLVSSVKRYNELLNENVGAA